MVVLLNPYWHQVVPSTFDESFDTANQGTLGPDLTWRAPLVGAFSIVSNSARITNGNDSSWVLFDQEFDPDAPVVVSAPVTVDPVAGGARIASVVACSQVAAQTGYQGRLHWTATAWFARISKSDGGTVTHLDSESISAPTPGDVIELTVDGDSLSLTLDDVEVASVTDDSITRGNYCGIFGFRSSVTDHIDQVQWASWSVTGVPL